MFQHDKNIIHRDIKAENIYFGVGGKVKLGDFGFSTAVQVDQELTTFCGSPPYAAPELFRDKSYRGTEVDLWALGVLAYFMVTGNTPFRGDTVAELKRMIIEGEYYMPESLSIEVQELIKAILKMDPKNRMPLEEIMAHPWMGNPEYEEAYEEYSVVPNRQESLDNKTVEKAWKIMKKYGVTGTMMIDAADKGARNAIVGTYRIVLYQMHMRKIAEDKQKSEQESEGEEDRVKKVEPKMSVKKQPSRLCILL